MQDFNSTKIGAGTITIGVGGGELSSTNNLADLNGGAGVRRGQFRITDRSGASTVVDISDAVTLQDVIKKINTSLDIQVQASAQGGHLVLTDTSGKTLDDLTVTDVGGGHSARDLGIAGNSNGTTTLTGTNVNQISRTTSLALLNDGNGVRSADANGDFSITPGDGGAAITVNLATATDVGDVLDAINTAGAGRVKADLSPDGSGIQLTDISGGGGAMTIAALNNSQAAHDLGLDTTGTGTITGRDLVAGLGTVLLSSLNGGAGLAAGTIAIKDRADTASINVDLSGSTSVQDLLDKINNSGASVQASLNSAGDGIQIVDTSGGSGTLQIDDSTGTTAQDLGIAGTFDVDTTVVKGANLHRQYVSRKYSPEGLQRRQRRRDRHDQDHQLRRRRHEHHRRHEPGVARRCHTADQPPRHGRHRKHQRRRQRHRAHRHRRRRGTGQGRRRRQHHRQGPAHRRHGDERGHRRRSRKPSTSPPTTPWPHFRPRSTA